MSYIEFMLGIIGSTIIGSAIVIVLALVEKANEKARNEK